MGTATLASVIAGFGVGVIATFVPLFGGLIAPKAIAKLRRPYVTTWLVAIAAGIIFWFYIDVMLDATQLDLIQGFGNGLGDYTHLVLALAFAAGVGLLFWLEKRFSLSKSVLASSDGPQMESTRGSFGAGMTFVIAAVAALGIGFHALGEGVDIGSVLTNTTDILGVIGGVLPGVAYVLHKGFEGFVVGVFAVVAGTTSARKILILGALSGIPTIIGFFIGIPSIVDSSYFFALGAAGAVYVEFKLIPLLARSGRLYASALPFVIGFYAMYFAGLFHN